MTTEKQLAVRNFRRYQHYKDRKPPWVKLLVDSLGDEQLNEMPTATRLLALLLLCVAANRDNRIPNDPAWIATECSLTRKEARLGLAQLLDANYLIPASKDASNPASETASETASNHARNPLAPHARPRAHGEAEAEAEAEAEEELSGPVRRENNARDADQPRPDDDTHFDFDINSLDTAGIAKGFPA